MVPWTGQGQHAILDTAMTWQLLGTAHEMCFSKLPSAAGLQGLSARAMQIAQ